VCASKCPAVCFFVPFSDYVFNSKSEIGEGGEEPGDGLFGTLDAANPRIGRVMEDVVRGDNLVYYFQFSLIPSLINEAAGDCLVFL
jgi:hypothetical protein